MYKLGLLNVAGMLSIFSMIFFVAPVQTGAQSQAEEPTWIWTRNNPKPAWWTWDQEYETAKPVRGGYMRYAVTQYVGMLNPNHWPVNDWSTISKIYEKMIYNDGSYRPSIPWLATSWEFPDSVTCIMKLRKGVTFYDGTEFNAHGYKYQIDWILDRNNGCWSRGWLDPIKSIEVLDRYTLKWTFKKPWAAFQGIMSAVPGFAISKNALEGDVLILEAEKLARKAERTKKVAAKAMKKANADSVKGEEAARKARIKAEKAQKKASELAELSKLASKKAKGIRSTDVNPVATGRYMLEEARPGNYLKLKRNPNWWFGKSIGKPEMPYFEGLIITVIPDPAIQLANLRAGKIDSMMRLSPSMYQLLANDTALVIHTQPGNQITGLRFNLAKGPCKDIRVRKAISHAIDRKALIQGLRFGLATPASCNYPAGHWCHNPDLKPVTYDPELSKKYLASAGYDKGLKISGYMFTGTTTDSLGVAVQRMLAQVGIDWAFKMLDFGAASKAMAGLDYDLGQGGYPDIYDPDMPATTLYMPNGGFNFGRSHNLKAIALIEAGRQEMDIRKRQQIYYELEKVLYDNYEDVWLWYPMSVWAYSKKIRGYNPELHRKGLEGYWNTHCLWFADGK